MSHHPVNAQKDTKKELKQSKEIYKFITENTIDLITVVNSKLKIEYINSKVYEQKMGYNESDLLNISPIKMIHPDDQKLVIKRFEEVLKTGEGTVTVRIKKKNGEYLWFESNGKRYTDSQGNVGVMIISRDVTKRRNNEQKIIESQKRYRELANTLPEVIFEIDLDFNLTYTNLIASKIFGYSFEEFKKGLTVFQFLHPDEEVKVIELIKKMFKGEEIKPEIVRLRTKDGNYIHMRAFLTPIFSEGKIIGGRSVLHDITDLMEVEDKLKESEEKFRTIAEQSLLGICIIQDEKVNYVNNVIASLLGYSTEEMMDWKSNEFFKTIHPEDKRRIIEIAISPEESFPNGIRSYEARGITKSGEVIWMDVYYKKIKFEEKPAFLISFNNISEKKKAEEDLRESEERYRFLFQKSPFPILLLDLTGKTIDCNSSLERLVGYDREKFIGEMYDKLIFVEKSFLSLLYKRFARLVKGEAIPPLDIQLIRKDGVKIWVNMESSRMKIEDQVYIIVMGKDISSTRKAEEKLKQLDEMRREFIDRASHELKTPITTVYGAYQLLNTLYKQNFEKEELELLEMAFSGTKRLKKLVDDLLDISKLESREVILEKTEINLSELIKDCVTELNYFIKRRNQEIELEIPDKLMINIDRSRIELVLTNLLTNSIKYTPKKGKICIKLIKFEDYVEFSIEDTGIGLTKIEIEKLFKKFTKIPNPYDDKIDIDLGSTGLGLHITKAMIELHNGTISVESKGKNMGSTFTVRLPFINE